MGKKGEGERERERTPGGTQDHRARRDRDNVRERERAKQSSPRGPRHGEMSKRGGTTRENKTARERGGEDRCSRQFRSGVSTCPPSSSAPLIIQI